MSEIKITLVTGGSHGLGKDMVTSIVKKGTGVILNYQINEAEANRTVQDIAALGQKAVALPLNMSDFASPEELVQQVATTLKPIWNRINLQRIEVSGSINV